MRQKLFMFARSGHLRVDITQESRGLICEGVKLPLLPRPPKKEFKYKLPVDLRRSKEPEEKLTLPKLAVRGHFEEKRRMWRPHVVTIGPPPAGLDAPRASLPRLEGFRPSKPLQPRLAKVGYRRTFRPQSGKDLELMVTNSPGTT
ncbi:hypothetical protein E1301_Tti001814 [Triplophysa tibetana]|uniref:Uncharacterized protein n=1 Tax=Triplophysa tibetana TaxID=1572043 RepID=A0A5A9P5J9_9TELE|nr:hypothetical protein E1301_Tti001814 [Triplophysa tibetana]